MLYLALVLLAIIAGSVLIGSNETVQIKKFIAGYKQYRLQHQGSNEAEAATAILSGYLMPGKTGASQEALDFVKETFQGQEITLASACKAAIIQMHPRKYGLNTMSSDMPAEQILAWMTRFKEANSELEKKIQDVIETESKR